MTEPEHLLETACWSNEGQGPLQNVPEVVAAIAQ